MDRVTKHLGLPGTVPGFSTTSSTSQESPVVIPGGHLGYGASSVQASHPVHSQSRVICEWCSPSSVVPGGNAVPCGSLGMRALPAESESALPHSPQAIPVQVKFENSCPRVLVTSAFLCRETQCGHQFRDTLPLESQTGNELTVFREASEALDQFETMPTVSSIGGRPSGKVAWRATGLHSSWHTHLSSLGIQGGGE